MTTLFRPAPRQQGPAERRFKDAIAAEVATGIPLGMATSRIVASQPAMHQAMLAEANENRRGGAQRQQAAYRTRPQPGPASAAWNAAIQARVAMGESQSTALRETVYRRPDLHAAFVNEVNGR